MKNKNTILKFTLAVLLTLLLQIQANATDRQVRGLTLHPTARPLGDFTYRLPDSTDHESSDLRGQFVVLNIWATWCGPCREEMPSLDRLASITKTVKVITISQDRAGMILVPKYFRDHQIKNLEPFFDSTGQSQRALDVMVMPTTLIINPDGQEVGRVVGSIDWSSDEAITLLKLITGSDSI